MECQLTEVEARSLGTDYRQNSWKAFRFVLPFIKPFLPRLLLVCLLDISISLTNLTVPWFGKAMIDQGFPSRDWNQVLLLALTIAGLTAFVYGMVGLRTFLYNSTEMLLGLSMRKKIYRHLQDLSLDTIESIPVGQQQFRVITDADRIAHMLVRILPTLTLLVEFALILTAAIYVEPILTMIVLGFLIPWTILFVWVTQFGRTFDRRRLRFAELRDSGILQAARSFSTIKSLGRIREEVHRNTISNISVQRVANQGYLILIGFEFVTLKLLPYLKSTIIFLYLAAKVVGGQMTLGMTVPMIAYLSRLSFPLERIVNFGCWIWQTMVSAERIMLLMETKPAIQDAEDSVRIESFSGRIVFDKVCFERPEVGRILDNVSIELNPGTFTAIVGPSGSGKSTLVNLILRNLDPSEGKVMADETDLKRLHRNSFVRQIGTVTQETFIFGGSLADNLRVASPLASDEEFSTVLEQVGLFQWVDQLPDGINQDLEGGTGLSAGQKQRIGIARALLTYPSLLILDEPTSALDSETERHVMETIRRVSSGTTVLLVTHRMGTVVHADNIIVLDHGKVIESGNHAELIAIKGLYAEMEWLHRATTAESMIFREAQAR
jgi:ABC-type multidrug transport system fused ATPase/permease subunit